MEAFLGLFVLITSVYGTYALGRLTYVKSAPLRNHFANHTEMRKAIEVDDLDRKLQDQEHVLWPEKKFDHVNCHVCGPGPLYRGLVPSEYHHPFLRKELQHVSDGYGTWQVERVVAARAESAEMVSSQVIADGKYTGTHTLMLDLDYPVVLMPSTTAGHYHLYADVPMTWTRYKAVLKAMAAAGLIEQGYYRAALRQGSTMLRPPWVEKKLTPNLNPDASRKSSGKRWDHRWTQKKQNS
jgi:hypothetical protein